MTDLVLCIVSTTMLFVIFKYFGRFKVENLQAITVNYLVAGSLGLLLSDVAIEPRSIVVEPWFVSAVVMGMCFIVTFSLIALSSQRVGVGITSVANKMSMVIPVMAGVLLFDERLGGAKLVGAVLALLSVVLSIWPKKEPQFDIKDIYLPILIFFGSGTLDAALNWLREVQVTEEKFAQFSSVLFFMSAITGVGAVMVRRLRHVTTFDRTSVIAGVTLGIPNYFSIYFLLRALNLPDFESTVIFPVVNTGIVLLSTLLAFVLFAERPSGINIIGVVLAVVSIVLLSL